MSLLRIVGGTYGGRRIQAPPGRNTRPTAEKVRAALFNSLANTLDLEGARVVDLYAGSGALGIEALSRGAGHVTFVEDDGRTAGIIRDNLKALGIGRDASEVVPVKAQAWIKRAPTEPPTHLVLLDPPYAAEEYEGVLRALAAWPGLAEGAIVVVEAPKQLDLEAAPGLPPGLEVLRVKRYGDTQLVYVQKRG